MSLNTIFYSDLFNNVLCKIFKTAIKSNSTYSSIVDSIYHKISQDINYQIYGYLQ